MKNSRSFFLLPVVIASSISLSGRLLGQAENVLNPLWYQSTSYSNLASGRSDIARLNKYTGAMVNPATLFFTSTTFSVEFPLRHIATGMYGLEYDQSTSLPSFLAAGFPTSIGYIQIGYARPYDVKISTGEIPVTTFEHPDGTGEYFREVTEGAIHTAFSAVSVSPLDFASIGFTVGLDYIRQRTSILHTWSLSSGYRYRVITGITVRPIAGIDFGLVARYAPPIDLQFTDNSDLQVIGGYDYRVEARSPLEIELGASFQLFPSLSLLVAFQHENWIKVFDNVSSLWQIRLGADYHVMPDCWLQIGYFSQYSPYTSQSAYFDQKFLTFGARICIIDSFELALSFISSRPYATDNGNTLSSYYPYSFERSFHRDEIRIGMIYSL